ncbi:hypothetical protein GXW77_20020 [Roseomonas alkaliterrae]|uniref:Flagellar protein FlgN n=1 Tax=Neoroseomonas alkaliterrae TaxID=1452450 RepID=A0A840YBB6_9PROT|nr:hypothetical protein [Neoroseomonas alkaliterrae]MBB5691842.1 hypothetical protein [Neoroseomonas alkaliterrae]MBR0678461.1 hypothetical protein [Neoroseomonas alkaliterrae]
MMDSLILAGQRLAEALRAENEALAALDLPRAAVLATGKIAASDAFAAAFAAQAKHGAAPAGPVREAAEILTRRLDELGRENRRLLERAVALQSRVIETIAGAALPRAPEQGYAPAGYRAPPRPPAIALSAQI